MDPMELPHERGLAGTRDHGVLGAHRDLPPDLGHLPDDPEAGHGDRPDSPRNDSHSPQRPGFQVPRDHVETPPRQRNNADNSWNAIQRTPEWQQRETLGTPGQRGNSGSSWNAFLQTPEGRHYQSLGTPEYRERSHIDRHPEDRYTWKPTHDHPSLAQPDRFQQPARAWRDAGGHQTYHPEKQALARDAEIVDNVRAKIAKDPDRFALTYTDKEIRALIDQGQRLGLTDRNIADLLHTGSRIKKPIAADNLTRQMHNWAKIVAERGYPYRFENSDHFNMFATDLERALREVGLGDVDPFIQGSSLRKPEADDVDFAIAIDRDRFNEILIDRYDGRIAPKTADGKPGEPMPLRGLGRDEIRELSDRILAAGKTGYTNQALTFANAVRSGIIKSTHDISKGLKQVGKEIKQKYPELNIEDISLVVPGSLFDSSPDLPVVETTDKARAQELIHRLKEARELESQRGHPDSERASSPSKTDNLYRIPGELPSDKPAPAVPERDDLPPTKGDLATERGPELVRDLAEQRANSLEGLESRQRDVVELAVDIANSRLPNIEATLEHNQAREALNRAMSALERGAPLPEVSKDLSLAREHLTTGQRLELESRLTTVRDLELGESARIAERILNIDMHTRDYSVTAQLEVAERQLVDAATQKVLEFREEHLKERNLFVQYNLDRTRQLERDIAQGKVPELADVLQNFDAAEQVIQYEREREARELGKLGLDREHRRLVVQTLEAERARTLGKARDAFKDEIVRQATDRVLAIREPEERARAQFLERVHEQTRELEATVKQGREPDAEYVRQTHDQLQRVIRYERSLESRALEPFGLNPEQARIVTATLEAQRLQTYGRALEVFGREAVRLEHNQIVGSTKALQLTREQVRTLDPKLYQLIRTHDPVSRNHEKGVLIYRVPGRDPVEVPYNSLTRYYADAAKAIERKTPHDQVLTSFLSKLSQGKDPHEVVREPPIEPPHVTRARELDERARIRLRNAPVKETK
ncbi:hypothetical protein [Nocardia transvalensis]|uniref:hypothetical protein n=1 Tax=Nocardia transvalensis TaxID=37333 RepID=UPI001E2B283A|nr:hypothetical protein [Nocardia transvalensis]